MMTTTDNAVDFDMADVPSHAGVPGDVSGRQRRQGLKPADSAAAAQA